MMFFPTVISLGFSAEYGGNVESVTCTEHYWGPRQSLMQPHTTKTASLPRSAFTRDALSAVSARTTSAPCCRSFTAASDLVSLVIARGEKVPSFRSVCKTDAPGSIPLEFQHRYRGMEKIIDLVDRWRRKQKRFERKTYWMIISVVVLRRPLLFAIRPIDARPSLPRGSNLSETVTVSLLQRYDVAYNYLTNSIQFYKLNNAGRSHRDMT
jgi:hypothetical protein